MAFDVFVSYATKDKIVADAVCARLESAGIRCWIAPRDIIAGTPYGEAIIAGIRAAKVMVLVFSSNANASGHIPKEVERAVSNGLAILPFRIEDVAPRESLDYFIGSVHWLDAMTPPLEKHLDALAATVHKLLPAAPDAPASGATNGAAYNAASGFANNAAYNAAQKPAASAAQASGSSRQSAAKVVAMVAAMAKSATAATAAAVAKTIAAARPAFRSAASTLRSQTARVSPANRIRIGAAAAVVLVVVAMGLILRGRGSSAKGADAPGPTYSPSSSSARGATTDPKPSAATVGSQTVSQPPSPSQSPSSQSTDPIVGCYQWFNNTQVVIRTDGTMVAGPFTARWRRAAVAYNAYTFTWPEVTDTVTISQNAQSLSGWNQYGFQISGTRLKGSGGLVGTWRWPNGRQVTVYPGGSFSSALFRGNWREVDASRGIYTLTWPNPVDSVTLSPDSSRISGVNQYGVPISGVTMHCPGT